MNTTKRRDFLKSLATAGVAAPFVSLPARAETAADKGGYYKTLPSLGEFDVVVFGAGPAGVGAAIRAARDGRKVALVEKYGFPGGVGVYGCTPIFFLFEHRGAGGWGAKPSNWKQIIRGLADEIVRRLDREGAASPMADGDCKIPLRTRIGDAPLLGKVMFRPDALRALLHRMLSEAGVTKVFYAHLCDVVTEGRTVERAVVSCLEGLRTIRAKAFVDATGDAHLVHLAGGRTVKPDPMHTMHKSAFMFLGGVEKGAVANYERLFPKLRAEGKLPKNVWAMPGYSELLDEGEIIMPIGFAVGDNTDSRDMTRMDEELRRTNEELVAALRREVPGFGKAHPIRQAMQVCSRDGRHIVARAQVGIEELANGPVPDDAVVPIWRWWGGEHAPDQSKGFGTPTSGYRPTLSAIPYRALQPEGFDNVLAAGRDIAVDAYSVTTVRMMPTCFAMGEAAGQAASIAVEKGVIASEVPYALLAERLQSANCIVR